MTANVHIYVAVLPKTSMAIVPEQYDLAQPRKVNLNIVAMLVIW